MRIEDYSPFNLTCNRAGCVRAVRRRAYVRRTQPVTSLLILNICEKCAAKIILLSDDNVITFMETKEENHA